ncbi:N-formylglutamate amidohydrolase, partial [Streptomyces kebangsaanensis]|uniref:N-formylglutamate amidohydrolase n=1 Tax=Streptomyces kebangsaanensis TaxID=864058 RepID=UPI000D1B8E3F
MPDTAPSFALLPGADDSPVILHVPHSAREIPADVRAGIVLDDGALERELDHITDSHTARIAEVAAGLAGLTPWRFVNRLSRLVVDPERFPDEREEMLAVGMGAVYTRTTHRDVLRAADTDPEPLIERYFRPYAEAMTKAVADRLAATGRAVIIDVHSYPSAALPYELHGEGPRPPVCLGTDAFHTPPELTEFARRAFEPCGETGLDSPFQGAYVPLEFYESDARVGALMVEIRRDTYMTEPGGPAGPGLDRLAEALA